LAAVINVLPKITSRLPKSHSVSDDGGDKHLNITQTIPEQRTGKAQHQGTTKNSHVAHCAQTA